MKSLFDNFTQQYSLSKTLRFELKPVGKTQQMLEDNAVFAKDELIEKKYAKTKPYFDRLHREFIEESLKGVSLTGLENHLKVLNDWQKDKKNDVAKKIYDNSVQNLREQIVVIFNTKAKDWANYNYATEGLKNKTVEILFEENVFEILKARYGEEKESFIEVEKLDKDGKSETKEISIFDSWKGLLVISKSFLRQGVISIKLMAHQPHLQLELLIKI